MISTIFSACYLEELEAFNGVGLQIVCSDSVIDFDWNKEVRYTMKNSIEKYACEKSSHLKAAEIFIDAVRTRNPQFIKSTYSDALKTFEITLAANESINSLKPVYL